MKIKFSRLELPKQDTFVLFVKTGGKLGDFGRSVDQQAGKQVSRAIKAANFSGARDSFLDLPGITGIGANRVVLAGIGNPADMAEKAFELLGGAIARRLQGLKISNASIAVEGDATLKLSESDAAARIASGARLRVYSFDTYKTKSKEKDKSPSKLVAITILSAAQAKAKKAYAPLQAIAEGVHIARDLVNEPPNYLHPEEFAKRAKALAKSGLKVEVMGEAKMKKLGMGSLLSVGYGSERECKLAIMKWDGGAKGEKPVAFVGKGVTFDTGGISLKPGAGMGDMKGDMGGAACVTGLMHALAARKAKVNAIGIIGLVENMPDGKATRPGDIVTSMSGQTIEILNTDAEGRLVLADALWYCQKRFKPQFMVDLATLTGAILIALGKEHAGLFSNSDKLSEQLSAAGETTGETVWRMPLGDAYDKMINSDFADMKNIGGREAGSTTAAQFLQRFVNEVPWVHLDVAGTAMGSKKTAINQSWGGGWGVRLLNQLVADHYEKK